MRLKMAILSLAVALAGCGPAASRPDARGGEAGGGEAGGGGARGGDDEPEALPCNRVVAPAPDRLDTAKLGRPIFSDEFNTLKRWEGRKGVWRTNLGYGGKWRYTNGKQEQLFVDRDFKGTGELPLGLDPLAIDGGVLTITADHAPPAMQEVGWGYRYTSGMVSSRPSFSQCYGYFETRAKLPAGRGLWPSFYLLPKNKAWPPEIDVFEVLGHEPDRIYGTVHWGPNASAAPTKEERRALKKLKEKKTFDFTVPGAAKDFHTYGVWWDAVTIAWYVDGAKVAQMPTPEGVDTPMFMIAALAVGGGWPGPPDATTPFPSVMSIDYIRAYRLPGQP